MVEKCHWKILCDRDIVLKKKKHFVFKKTSMYIGIYGLSHIPQCICIGTLVSPLLSNPKQPRSEWHRSWMSTRKAVEMSTSDITVSPDPAWRSNTLVRLFSRALRIRTQHREYTHGMHAEGDPIIQVFTTINCRHQENKLITLSL